MSEYINENADIFDDEPKKQNIVIRILKWLAIAILLLISGILFYRCVSSADHPVVKKVLVSDDLLAYYNENGVLAKVEKYGMQSPWIDVRQGRLIEFNNLYYIPETNELQFSFKYNEDIVDGMLSDFPFSLTLVDDEGNEYTEYFYETAKRERYRYARICFSDIELVKDGQFDEEGLPIRYTYKLRIDFEHIEEDGSTQPLELVYSIYDGKHISKNVEYSIK